MFHQSLPLPLSQSTFTLVHGRIIAQSLSLSYDSHPIFYFVRGWAELLNEWLCNLGNLAPLDCAPESQLSPTPHKRLEPISVAWWFVRWPLSQSFPLFDIHVAMMSVLFLRSLHDA